MIKMENVMKMVNKTTPVKSSYVNACSHKNSSNSNACTAFILKISDKEKLHLLPILKHRRFQNRKGKEMGPRHLPGSGHIPKIMTNNSINKIKIK